MAKRSWKRWTLIGFVAVVLLLVAAVGLLFVPAVQKALLQRAAARAGVDLQLDSVQVDFGGVRIKALRLKIPEGTIACDAASASLPLWPAVRSRRLDIESLELSGLDIALAAPGQDAEPGASEPSTRKPLPGLLPSIDLPLHLRLRSAMISGRITVPATDRSAHVADFAINGTGGVEGLHVTWSATAIYRPPTPDIISAAELSATAVTVLGHDFKVVEAAIAVAPVATAGDAAALLPTGGALTATTDGEDEHIDVVFHHGTAAEAKESLRVSMSWSAASQRLAGTLQSSLSALGGEAFGYDLGSFAGAEGKADFSVDAATRLLSLAGRVQAPTALLAILVPAASGAPMTGLTTVDAKLEASSEQVDIERLAFVATHADGRPMLSVRLLAPFTADLPIAKDRLPTLPPGRLAAVSVDRMPIDWLCVRTPFMGCGDAHASGSVEIRTDGTRFEVSATNPVVVADLDLVRSNTPLLRGVTAAIVPSIAFAPGGDAKITLSGRLSHGEAELMELEGALTAAAAKPLAVQASGRADLAAWAKQPIGARLPLLASGEARFDLDGTLGAEPSFRAGLKLGRLIRAEGGPALPAIEANLALSLAAEKVVRYQGEVKTQGAGSTSDALCEGTVRLGAKPLQLSTRLRSSHVDLAQLRALTGLAPRPAEAAETGASPDESETPSRPTGAAWAAVVGDVDAMVENFVLAPGTNVSSIVLRLGATPAAVEVVDFSARFAEARLAATGTLDYRAKTKDPYEARGSMIVHNLDAGRALRSLMPGTPPPIEGVFSMTNAVRASGESLADLTNRFTVAASVRGSNGVVRLFENREPELLAKLKKIDNMIQTGAALGELFKIKELEKLAKPSGAGRFTAAVENLDRRLKKIDFERMTADAVFESQRRLDLREVQVYGKDLYIGGAGRIAAPGPGAPVATWPMRLQLRLGARNELQEDMAELELLGQEIDANGYALMRRPIAVTGTIKRPDPGDLWNFIIESALAAAAR